MASDESGWRKDHNRPEWIVAVELQESELSPSCRSRVGMWEGGVGVRVLSAGDLGDVALPRRAGGEFRNSNCGNWKLEIGECEGENVGMWCGV